MTVSWNKFHVRIDLPEKIYIWPSGSQATVKNSWDQRMIAMVFQKGLLITRLLTLAEHVVGVFTGSLEGTACHFSYAFFFPSYPPPPFFFLDASRSRHLLMGVHCMLDEHDLGSPVALMHLHIALRDL